MENTFCFIACTNNPVWIQECSNYINHLLIPDGYQISILTIENAKSMADGYNYAMNSSKAKYKIYLHQDTFIINPYFLYDILTIFENPTIGMIGVVGSPKLPSDGMMWHGERVGALYQQQQILDYSTNQSISISYTEVECVDGLIIATQHDIPWRSDLFTGWDFYDISQSFEFRKNQFKVVVPNQTNPWVIHDPGKTTLWNYNKSRQIFLNQYADMFSLD